MILATTVMLGANGAPGANPTDGDRREALDSIESNFPHLLEWHEVEHAVPAGMRLVSQGETMRILKPVGQPDGRGEVSLGVFGWRDPATGEFHASTSELERTDDALRPEANPYLLELPSHADGWFLFGPDRDKDTTWVKYRLTDAAHVPASTPTPGHALYADAIDGIDGVTADIVGVFDGRGSYSDYLLARDIQPEMTFTYDLELGDGVAGRVDELGGVTFEDANHDIVVRISPPIANDGSDAHVGLKAEYQLDGDVLTLTVHTDEDTVAPVLIDPEWEMKANGLEYRCVETDTACDTGNNADTPDNHTPNGSGYTGVEDIRYLRAGIRVTKFACNPPDDGREGTPGYPGSQENQNRPRFTDGNGVLDTKSVEICTNAFAYPNEPHDSRYIADKRWSVTARVEGPDSQGYDEATVKWSRVGLTWCSGNTSDNTIAGIISSAVPSPTALTNPEPRWIEPGAHWSGFTGACPGFQSPGTSDEQFNGVQGCGGHTVDCGQERYLARKHFDVTGSRADDLYAGLFSGAPKGISSVQSSRIAIVERLWDDRENAQAENFRPFVTNPLHDVVQSPAGSGIEWTNSPRPQLKVNLTDNLSGVRTLDATIDPDRGMPLAQDLLDHFVGANNFELGVTRFNDDEAEVKHPIFVTDTPATNLVDDWYSAKLVTQDWANFSGRTSANPWARNGAGAVATRTERFVVDTHAPAITSLAAVDAAPGAGRNTVDAQVRLTWPALNDYPGGDRDYFVSQTGKGNVAIVAAPTTTTTVVPGKKDPCNMQTYTFSVVGRDNSPFRHVGGAASASITLDHRETPAAPATLELVRGATGIRAIWGAVDHPCTFTYNVEWDDNSTFTSPDSTSVPSGTTNTLITWPTCTRVWVRVRAESTNTFNSAWQPTPNASATPPVAAMSERVDCRPTIQRSDQNVDQRPGGNNIDPIRYFNVDDAMQQLMDPSGDVNRNAFERVVVRTVDIDGAQDLSDLNVVHAAVTATSTRHSARAVLRITDPTATPTHDEGAKIVWTFSRTATPSDVATVTLQENASTQAAGRSDSGTSRSCNPGEKVRLVGTYWQLDCQHMRRPAVGTTGFDLNIPIRPTTAADQRYQLHGCVHDRAQPADYRYLHNNSTNTTGGANPAAGDPTAADATQLGSCEWIALGPIVVDRTPPANAQLQFVRGATGARARWNPVFNDRNGAADLSGIASYDWTGTDNATTDECVANISQPAGAVATTWIETALCQNGGIEGSGTETDQQPGTSMTFDVTTIDVAGNRSTQGTPPSSTALNPATVTGTVDQRPDVTRPVDEADGPEPDADVDWRPIYPADTDDSDDVRYDSFNGRIYPAPNGTRSRDIHVVVSDPDGIQDLRDEAPTDVAAPARRVNPDWAELVVDIHDRHRTTRNASLRIAFSFGNGTGAAAGAPTVTIREEGGTPTTCASNAAGTAFVGAFAGTYWTLDCSQLTRTVVTNGYAMVLPVRPTDAGAGSPNRYVTPDHRYDVRGYVRDRRQEADYRFLSNATTNSPGSPPSPAADTAPDAFPPVEPMPAPAGFVSRDLGQLWLDRIVPTGRLLNPNAANVPFTATGLATVRLDTFAADVLPSAATSPTLADATGLAMVRFTAFRRDPNTGADGAQFDLNPDPASASALATCDRALPLTQDVQARCWFDWTHGLTGVNDINVHAMYVDRAGNHSERRGWLRIIVRPGEEFNSQYPHVDYKCAAETGNGNQEPANPVACRYGDDKPGSDPNTFFAYDPDTSRGFPTDDDPDSDMEHAIRVWDFNLYLQCGGAGGGDFQCITWNGKLDLSWFDDADEFRFTATPPPALDSTRDEFQTSTWDGTEITTFTQIRGDLTTPDGTVNDAHMLLVTRTNGGEDADLGTLSLWVWEPGTDRSSRDNAEWHILDAIIPATCQTDASCAQLVARGVTP